MTYKLDHFANIDGTYRVSEIKVSPSLLVEVFGKPVPCDSYKVTGMYVFESDDGDVFTLYDYKNTSRYDPYMVHPEVFWNRTSPENFSVGGRREQGSHFQFKAWLREMLGEGKRVHV